jgi:hypothetical protein
MSYRYVKLPKFPHWAGILSRIPFPHSILQREVNQIEVPYQITLDADARKCTRWNGQGQVLIVGLRYWQNVFTISVFVAKKLAAIQHQYSDTSQ